MWSPTTEESTTEACMRVEKLDGRTSFATTTDVWTRSLYMLKELPQLGKETKTRETGNRFLHKTNTKVYTVTFVIDKHNLAGVLFLDELLQENN